MALVNDVWQGMTVVGADGREIGTVAAVYPEGSDRAMGDSSPLPAPGDLGPRPEPDLAATSATAAPGSGTAPNPITERTRVGRIVVTHGGVLGIGEEKLTVPGAAIAGVVPGERVELSCRAEECRERYG